MPLHPGSSSRLAQAHIDESGVFRLSDRCDLQSIYTREDEGRERIPHTWASSDENYLKSRFGSVSYCVVILRTTPHWSVRMTSCSFRLLTWEQQIKITFAARVRTDFFPLYLTSDLQG